MTAPPGLRLTRFAAILRPHGEGASPLTPTLLGPTPVEKIDIERLRFDYSLPMLVRYGIGEFLRSYEVHHADLAFVALPSKTTTERREKLSIVNQIRVILAQPAAYADRAEIEDFNIRVRTVTNETVVQGVHLLLAPDKAGYVRVRHIAIPGLPVWENLHAETSYTARNLFIKNLEITPDLVLRDANFDASRRSQHKGNVSFRADIFGGELWMKTSGNRLREKGKNLDHSYDTETDLTVKNVNVRAAAAYFGLKNLPVESVGALDAHFKGEPEKPRTWDGNLTARIERIAAGRLQIEVVNLASSVKGGVAKTTLDAALAGNTLQLSSTAQVPESVNDFDTTDGEATLQLDGSHLADIGPALGLREPLSGTGAMEGRVKLRDRIASAEMSLNVDKLDAGAVGAESARVKLSVTKKFGQSGVGGVNAQLSADLAALRFQTFATDSATVRVAMNERVVTMPMLEIHRGENSISAHGTYEIPLDFKEAAKAPVDVRFAIKAPEIAAFGIALKDHPLEGRLAGQGDVKLVDGAPVGAIELDGAFKLGGFTAESLFAKVKLADRTAEIGQLALKINGTDQITATGKIGIDAPNTYDSTLNVGIKNLAALQPLLEVFGVKESLAGSLDLDWSGKGDFQPANHAGELKVGVAKARYGKTDLNEFRLAGIYGPGFAKSTELRIASGITKLAGSLDFDEGKLKLRDIVLEQGQRRCPTRSATS